MRRAYSDRDRARVFAALEINEGNIKRTARETMVPVSTVRLWKKDWERDGVPKSVIDVVPAVAQTALDRMVEARDLAVDRLLVLIPQAGVPQIPSLGNLVGIFSDKIDRANGLANQRVEVEHKLPDTDKILKALPDLVARALTDAQERQEILDAEVVEQSPRELVASTSE